MRTSQYFKGHHTEVAKMFTKFIQDSNSLKIKIARFSVKNGLFINTNNTEVY